MVSAKRDEDAPNEIVGERSRAADADALYSLEIFVNGLTGNRLVRIFRALQQAGGPRTTRDYVWHKKREVAIASPKAPTSQIHSTTDLDWVATELNDRPRKRVGFNKPIEEILCV